MLRVGVEARGWGEGSTHVDDSLLKQHDSRHWLADDGNLEEDAGFVNQDFVQCLARSSKLGWGGGSVWLQVWCQELLAEVGSFGRLPRGMQCRSGQRPAQQQDQTHPNPK